MEGPWRARRLDPLEGRTWRGPARVDRLTGLFFGTTIDTDRGRPPVALLGYQLLSALAGTLADAKSDGAAHAVVLIHEFRTPLTAAVKHEQNARVLDAFLERFHGEAPDRSGTDEAWITAPTLMGTGDAWVPEGTPISFAKLQTTVKSLMDC